MAKQKNEVAVTPKVLPPALTGELAARMAEVKENLESVENFRVPRIKMTDSGFQVVEGEPALKELECVIVHSKKTNVYYAKPFKPGQIEPPDCFSLDAIIPDKSVEKPQHKTCSGCPKAEFGTNAFGSGKACRNLKPLFVLLGDEAIIPYQLTVTPTSLKAANGYFIDLTAANIPYRSVKTKISSFKKDPQDKYVALKFSKLSKLTEKRVAEIQALKSYWLPIMENQVAGHDELDKDGTTQVQNTNGEF
jgi:hypothetical protein